jgi:TM2 domain-containing membrane protein YozV
MTDTVEQPNGSVPIKQSPRHESATLKRAGLAAIVLSGAVLNYLSSSVDTTLWAALVTKYAAGPWSLGLFLIVGVMAINLGVAGVLAIVTGVRRLSLANDATRKGLVVMWLGIECLVIALLAGSLIEGHNDRVIEWADAPALLAWVFAGAGVLLIRTGWKYDVERAATVIASDPRAPVIYLRSFQDDVKSPVGGALGLWLKVPMYFFPTSFEQELAAIMNRVGPFVAVGRPGERLPELGANRFYFSDEEWQTRVAELVQTAQLTVILCGPTPSLWWEIDHVLDSVSPQRVVLLIPERGQQTRELEKQLEHRLRAPGAIHRDDDRRRSILATLVSGPDPTIGKVVYFKDGWTPSVQAIRMIRDVRKMRRLKTWLLVLRRLSPFGEPLESAFEVVLRDLGFPWKQPGPSRLLAIFLAISFGWLGAHRFYLGDRRTGVKYLTYCWTMIPIFLSLRDATRLVLMERETFDNMYERSSS